jgi:transcription elongation factor S-II|tara:strand:+ start:232 stop:762 length:531 start_codon:yes stop_codon:yes gene_type:complete
MENFSNTSDVTRNKMVEYLNRVLNDNRLSRKVEKSIYNYIISISKEKNIQRKWSNSIFLKLYESKVLSIYSNLKKDSYIKNITFEKRLKGNKIKVKDIGTLSVYDIFPDNWKDLLNAKSKRDKIKYQLKPEAMTNLFKCHKCGSRETSYYEVQTRSADEPMTQFITCLQCNNHWKQ